MSESSWRYLEDSTFDVPGLTFDPVKTDRPYLLSRVFSGAEANRLYYSVLRNYKSKQLHRVYKDDGVNSHVDINARYTHSYELTPEFYELSVAEKMLGAVKAAALSEWGLDVAAEYTIQILGYEERCMFRTHSDNSLQQSDGRWVRNDTQRDLTGILYLSECVDTPVLGNEYCGGEICFDNTIENSTGRVVSMKPARGMMAVFPSNPMHRHSVPPIIKGYRVAVVNWYSVHKL
jgi:Rps23 Pro-64 3,4-dihydroxylase Tpa1-like proline 4-hydroxylase